VAAATFEIPQRKIYAYKWFDVLVKDGHYLIGYVIMPSHLHAIIAFRNRGKASIVLLEMADVF